MNAKTWKQLFSTAIEVSENRFQPQQKDVEFIKDLGFYKVPLSMWIETSVYYPNFRVDLNIERDQYLRARVLIDFYFKTGRDIVLMDGHGRMVRYLLMGGIPPTRIHVVEISPIVHEFHKSFFPRAVQCYLGNIFTQTILAKDPFYYYNFCGVRDSVDLLTTIKDEHMISFSIMRGNAHYGKKLLTNKRKIMSMNRFTNTVTKKLNFYLKNCRGRIISNRSDFITIWVQEAKR